MSGKNRCGAIGTIQKINGAIVFVVERLVTETLYEAMVINLPVDLEVGTHITLPELARDNRGIAVEKDGIYIDEGEIWPKPDTCDTFEFLSDNDNGPFAHADIERLIGMQIRLKEEIFDQIGAARRLREIKRALLSS